MDEQKLERWFFTIKLLVLVVVLLLVSSNIVSTYVQTHTYIEESQDKDVPLKDESGSVNLIKEDMLTENIW